MKRSKRKMQVIITRIFASWSLSLYKVEGWRPGRVLSWGSFTLWSGVLPSLESRGRRKWVREESRILQETEQQVWSCLPLDLSVSILSSLRRVCMYGCTYCSSQMIHWS